MLFRIWLIVRLDISVFVEHPIFIRFWVESYKIIIPRSAELMGCFRLWATQEGICPSQIFLPIGNPQSGGVIRKVVFQVQITLESLCQRHVVPQELSG